MITFVCEDCKDQDQSHEKCKGGTWCDCQHREPVKVDPDA